MVVEDELVVAAHLKSELEELGYMVCSMVASYNAAIRQLSESEPDILFI